MPLNGLMKWTQTSVNLRPYLQSILYSGSNRVAEGIALGACPLRADARPSRSFRQIARPRPPRGKNAARNECWCCATARHFRRFLVRAQSSRRRGHYRGVKEVAFRILSYGGGAVMSPPNTLERPPEIYTGLAQPTSAPTSGHAPHTFGWSRTWRAPSPSALRPRRHHPRYPGAASCRGCCWPVTIRHARRTSHPRGKVFHTRARIVENFVAAAAVSRGPASAVLAPCGERPESGSRASHTLLSSGRMPAIRT
jgi:hypothetical protein